MVTKLYYVSFYQTWLGSPGGNQERSSILNEFKDGIKNPYLPEGYKKALEENSLTVDDVILNLQSNGNETC